MTIEGGARIEDVLFPQHLVVFPFRRPERGTPPGTRVRMEVYTGWVALNIIADDELLHVDVLSFVPREPMIVDEYPLNPPGIPAGSSVLDVTVTAAPSSVAEDGDAVFAVDQASCSVIQQTQLNNDPFLLILRASLGWQRCTFHSITYQITVLSNPIVDKIEHTLEQGQRPLFRPLF
jgi:hypothetical protein